jgi:hypothetical protein
MVICLILSVLINQLMRASLVLILTVIFVLIFQAVDAQKVLLLQKPGKSNRYFYTTGDRIGVRMGDPEFDVSGEITYIDDSTCIVNRNYTIQLSKVHQVYIKRPFLSGSWRMMFIAAGVYFVGSMFNHAINHEEPLIDNTVPYVSGSFVALGTTAYLLRNKHCKMENGWKLKVLDYDIFKEKKEVQE